MKPHTNVNFHTLAHFVSLKYKRLFLKVPITVPFYFSFCKTVINKKEQVSKSTQKDKTDHESIFNVPLHQFLHTKL